MMQSINIGKNGITPTMVEEIRRVLKKYKTVRVKFLKSFMHEAKKTQTKKQIFQDLAERTGSRIEKAVGFVVILKK